MTLTRVAQQHIWQTASEKGNILAESATPSISLLNPTKKSPLLGELFPLFAVWVQWEKKNRPSSWNVKLGNSGVSKNAIMNETERPRGADIPRRGLACRQVRLWVEDISTLPSRCYTGVLFLAVLVTLGFVGSFFLPGLRWKCASPHPTLALPLPALETPEFSSKPNLNPSFFQENPTLPQPRINLFLFSTPSIFSILLTRSPCPLHTICVYIFCCLYWVEVSRGQKACHEQPYISYNIYSVIGGI